MRKFLLAGVVGLLVAGSASAQGLLISEYFANPGGNDLNNEYVELIATDTINFATTPYSVVWANNGTATGLGWKRGATITYGFQITTGSVNAGDVIYVGGSTLATQLTGSPTIGRTIQVTTTGGDGGLGSAQATAGVMGNGGGNADGIAVFVGLLSGVTDTTIPTDAVFYGSGLGIAVVSGGTDGYVLPDNDFYNGGFLQTTSFIGPDAGTANARFRLTGAYNATTDTWTTPRTITTDTTASVAGVSTVAITVVTVPEAGTVALFGLGLLPVAGLIARRKK